MTLLSVSIHDPPVSIHDGRKAEATVYPVAAAAKRRIREEVSHVSLIGLKARL
jgi:hypothetical protein